MKLLPKITILILVVLIGLLSIFSYIIISDEKKTFNTFLQKEGDLLTKTISASSIETILVDDYPLLESILSNISKTYKSISYIKIIKDKKIISQINNSLVESSDILTFKANIEIDSDVIALIELGLSTNEYDEIIKKKIKQFLLLISIISLLLFLLLLYVIEKYLLVHIDELESHMKLIGTEHYDEVIKINTSDEFEGLANSINNMTKRINESYTNLKQLTITLEKQKQDLEEANKYKNDFLANMSHELKTPLNSINVISSIMMKNKNKSLDEKQIKNLQIINHCGNDLLYLINDVLDISKLEAGELKLDFSQENLYDIMCQVKEMFEPQVNEKNLNFIFECDKNIGDIYSDKHRIKQIIKNLLSNSLKFTKKGSIRFIVKDSKENFVVLIEDNGIGIEENKLKHIFDRFKQADGSTTRKFGGTGLGLAICKELLILLEGEINVSSELNQGTIFSVIIPKNKDKVKNEQRNEENLINSIPERKKILLLNNDPVSFLSLAVELKKKFDLKQVSQISELTSESKKSNYEFIIIDISNEDIVKIRNIINDINKKIVFIYKDRISEDLIKEAYLTYEKPINKSAFLLELIK